MHLQPQRHRHRHRHQPVQRDTWLPYAHFLPPAELFAPHSREPVRSKPQFRYAACMSRLLEWGNDIAFGYSVIPSLSLLADT
jgi:hypothetical protein